MKKSEHIESRLYSRNIKIIYLGFDPNLLRFSRFSSGFCPDFAPILSSKDLPRSQFFLTKDSELIQCPHFGPDFRTLVRIRTFLGKVVRIWSGFCSKVRIFHKNKERTLKYAKFECVRLDKFLMKCCIKSIELT